MAKIRKYEFENFSLYIDEKSISNDRGFDANVKILSNETDIVLPHCIIHGYRGKHFKRHQVLMSHGYTTVKFLERYVNRTFFDSNAYPNFHV